MQIPIIPGCCFDQTFPSIDINDRNSTDVGGVTVTGIMALAKGENQDGHWAGWALGSQEELAHVPPAHSQPLLQEAAQVRDVEMTTRTTTTYRIDT